MSVGGKTSNNTAKVFGKNFEKRLAVKQVRVSRSGIPQPRFLAFYDYASPNRSWYRYVVLFLP